MGRRYEHVSESSSSRDHFTMPQCAVLGAGCMPSHHSPPLPPASLFLAPAVRWLGVAVCLLPLRPLLPARRLLLLSLLCHLAILLLSLRKHEEGDRSGGKPGSGLACAHSAPSGNELGLPARPQRAGQQGAKPGGNAVAASGSPMLSLPQVGPSSDSPGAPIQRRSWSNKYI